MAIDELPDGPDPAVDPPQVFSQKAAAMVLAQKAMIPQINNALTSMNQLQAGGAYALPYVFDTAIADADPGAGKLRLSSATQSAATVMRLDLTAGGQDYTTLLDTFSSSTSVIKGTIRLVKMSDMTKWMTFDVTARAAPAGYRNLTVVCTDSSSASPFGLGDDLMLFFQRTGDRGQQGANGVLALASATISAPVVSIDFLNVFTADYDKYTIELQGIVNTGGGTSNFDLLQLAIGGVARTSGYTSNAVNGTGTGATGGPLALGSPYTATVEIRNANGTFKTINASIMDVAAREYGASISDAAPATGFRIIPDAGTFTAGTIRIFGHRNS